MFFENLFSSSFINIGLLFLAISSIISLIISLFKRPLFKLNLKRFLYINTTSFIIILIYFKVFYYDINIQPNNLEMIKYISSVVENKPLTEKELNNLNNNILIIKDKFDVTNYVYIREFNNLSNDKQERIKKYLKTLKDKNKTIVFGDYFFLSYLISESLKEQEKDIYNNMMKLNNK